MERDGEEEPSKAVSVGGAIDLLIKAAIPETAKQAVTKVVLGFSGAAASWLGAAAAKGDQVRSAIDLKAARERLEAAAGLMPPEAAQDPRLALAFRSIQREAIEGLAKQENRDEVAREAVVLLADKAPGEDVKPVDEDWLNVFSGLAEKATSERLRKHWGAVLAGEIRQPGTFSLAGLQLMSLLDEQLAKTIAKASAWVMVNSIPFPPSFNFGPGYRTLLDLQEVGFLTMGHTQRLPPAGLAYYPIGSRRIFVMLSKQLELPNALLTRAGNDLMKIVPRAADDGFVQEVLKLFLSKGASYADTKPPPPGEKS